MSFVRTPGEAGDALRMRLWGKDGGAAWHAVDLRQRHRRAIVSVTADGSVSFRGVVLGPGFSIEAEKTFRKAMKTLAQRQRNPDGSSELEIVLAVSGKTPWRMIQYVLMSLAHPEVGVYRIRYATLDDVDAIENKLPRDRGLTPQVAPSPAKIKVKLFRKGDETTFRLGPGQTTGSGSLKDESGWQALEALIQAARAAGGADMVGEIVAPPPTGGKGALRRRAPRAARPA